MQADERTLNAALRALHAELTRERIMRLSVYPQLITFGKLTKQEQLVRMARLEWGIKFIRYLNAAIPDPSQLPFG